MREVVRAALRTRRRRLLVLGAVAVVAAASAASVLFGTTGLVIVLVGLQLLTVLGLVHTRTVLGRASAARYRTNRERLERELRQRDARLAAVEQQSARLVGSFVIRQKEHARTLAELGHPDEAITAFEHAIELAPEDRDLQRHHLAAVAGSAGDDAESAFLAAIDRQISARNADHVGQLARAGLEHAPDSARLHDHLVAALDVADRHEEALEAAVAGARRHLTQLQARRGSVAAVTRLTPQRRVFISGFFYSGSGAVLDHLVGFPGVVKWPRGEMRLIKFPGGLDDIGKRLIANGVLVAQDLVDLYLHVTGSKLTFTEEGTYDKWRSVNTMGRRMFERDLDRSSGFLITLFEGFLELVDRVQQGTLDVEAFEAHFRAVMAGGLDAAATDSGADYVVVDQAVTAWRLDIARFLPPSSFVMVHRDPRDQYAEVREVMSQPGRRRKLARSSRFASVYRRNREFAESWIPQLQERYDHRFQRVSFEDFVVEHVRVDGELRRFLGLEDREPTTRRFRPEQSIVNVGKHRALLEPEVVERLRSSLGEYFNPHADDVASRDDIERPVEGTALGWERATR